MKETWYFSELPKGFYSASVSGAEDRWTFRAHPNQGDWCVEGVFSTREEACAAGEAFARGDQFPGLYSASW